MSALPLVDGQYSTFQNASQYDFHNVMVSYGICRVGISKNSSHPNLTTRIIADLELILLTILSYPIHYAPAGSAIRRLSCKQKIFI